MKQAADSWAPLLWQHMCTHDIQGVLGGQGRGAGGGKTEGEGGQWGRSWRYRKELTSTKAGLCSTHVPVLTAEPSILL